MRVWFSFISIGGGVFVVAVLALSLSVCVCVLLLFSFSFLLFEFKTTRILNVNVLQTNKWQQTLYGMGAAHPKAGRKVSFLFYRFSLSF